MVSACAEIDRALCDNESGPGGAVNTNRSLTRSLDLREEGLAMQATRVSRMCIGCGRPTPAQTIGQPRKWCSDDCRTFHYRERKRRPRPTFADRLNAKLALGPDGCVEFTGHRNACGYGVIRDEAGRACLAHRAAWMLHRGPIPDGLGVLHSCDNPPCCNVDHLSLGTHSDNMRHRDERGRTLAGEVIGKHSDSTIRQVRKMLAGGATHRQITDVTGVSSGHISYIRHRPTWRLS